VARLYDNEHFPARAVAELRRLGHDVLTVQETGRANLRWPDAEVLKFATADNRVVVTLNRQDFFKLHEVDSHHAGIIACARNNNFPELATLIHQVLNQEASFDGRVLRVYRPHR